MQKRELCLELTIPESSVLFKPANNMDDWVLKQITVIAKDTQFRMIRYHRGNRLIREQGGLLRSETLWSCILKRHESWALFHYSAITFNSNSTSTTRVECTPSLHHCIFLSLHQSINSTLHHTITSSFHHFKTASLQHSITSTLQHSITSALKQSNSNFQLERGDLQSGPSGSGGRLRHQRPPWSRSGCRLNRMISAGCLKWFLFFKFTVEKVN